MMVSLLVLVVVITAVSCLPTKIPHCRILSASPTETGGHVIRCLCDGYHLVTLDLLESTGFSSLAVSGEQDGRKREFVKVEYYANAQDMFIVLDGDQFDVKDTRHQEEGLKLKKLFEDPEFRFFPVAVKLIHDELQLKGWESPAVMFLYRMGMAADNFHHQKRVKRSLLTEAVEVDPRTYEFNGPNATKMCTFNGWSAPDMEVLIADECRGLCGKTCKECWNWVCGDCCAHTGCLRHDDFCSGGYYTYDCLSCRGVLWDTITSTPLDC